MESRYQRLIKKMVIDKQLPESVYRMRSVNRYLFDSLINSEMWFSNPTDFNDPFDCGIDMKIQNSTQQQFQTYFEKYLAKHLNSDELSKIDKTKITRKKFEDLINKVAKRVTQKKGIACFMSNCENLLMWAHYADSHKGVSLKFNILEDTEFFSPMKKVIYEEDYPEYDYLTNKNDFVNQMFFVKSEDWKYEEEVRILKNKSGNYKFNSNSLKEVIFGCKISEGDKKTLTKIIRNYYQNCKLTQAYKHKSKFGLEFKDVK